MGARAFQPVRAQPLFPPLPLPLPPPRPPSSSWPPAPLNHNQKNNTTIVPVLALLLLFLVCTVAGASDQQDVIDIQTLQKLRGLLNVANPNALSSWDPAKSGTPCSVNTTTSQWEGVTCLNGNVVGIQLEGMGLQGQLDLRPLVGLPYLRTLSFMNNNFDGPMPELTSLATVRSFFLSNNTFSGVIPDDAFNGMPYLKKLYLGGNNFSGPIPSSLASSDKLEQLSLVNNHFSGPIPSVLNSLTTINVANNQLEGPIPDGFMNFPPSSFAGNKDLCGKPLQKSCNSPPSPPPSASPPEDVKPSPDPTKSLSPPNHSSTLSIAIILICCVVAFIVLVVLSMVCRGSRKAGSQTEQLGRAGSISSYQQSSLIKAQYNGNHPVELEQATGPTSSAKKMGGGAVAAANATTATRKPEQGKLSFVRDDRQRFELQDLLRASAEVLGSGSFGSAYKAVLMDGQAVVVKRFKQMTNVGKEEFHEHMRRMGRLTHPNLLPLVAYYYRKEEKLFVFDFVHNGSLAKLLHGNRNGSQKQQQPPRLDWPTRLKIIKGVSKGLAYLYSELPSLTVPHGHLKSSNVLLDKSMEPHLMDYLLLPVLNQEHAQQLLVAYKSPECAHQGRTTKKTDVWNLGILILEILTGKIPANYFAHGTGYSADLAAWVEYTAAQESTEIFDQHMDGTSGAIGEMTKLLKIGIACCDENLETRLDLKEAVEKIGALRERDTETLI